VGREEGTLQHGDCRAMCRNQKKDEEVDVWVITEVEKRQEWTLSMEKYWAKEWRGRSERQCNLLLSLMLHNIEAVFVMCRGP
jgi:hypothetical protein